MSISQNLDVKKTLPLPDGGSIILIDVMGRAKSETWEQANRNIYRVSAERDVVWQIQTMSTPDERFPYTNVYFDDMGNLNAYCWDGGEYAVDIDSGAIDKGRLAK